MGSSGCCAFMQIDQPLAGIAGRAQIDFVLVDGRAARAHLLDEG